jgi:hypothetical protein
VTEEKGDDGLSKEIRHGTVKHSADGTDSIMQHTVKISLSGPDEVAF